MLINIILSSYNRPEFLRRAMASLVRQTCGVWQCWVVECNSNNPAVNRVIASFTHDRRFMVSHLPITPTDEAEYNNDILAQLHADNEPSLLAWMCDNTEYSPDFVRTVLDWFAKNPHAHAGYVTHERDIFSPDGLTREGPASMSGHWDIVPPVPGVTFMQAGTAVGNLDHSQVIHRIPSAARWKTAAQAGRREVDGVYFDDLIKLHGAIYPIQPGTILSIEHLAWRENHANV